MNRNRRTAPVCWVVFSALVLAALVGCASESTPRVPAPPPFVPASVVVTLGTEGGATTLISTQSGGWTHNGQPFTSGSTVKGQNAATYRLTLSGDSWSAVFVPPDPARVRLGTSGDEVTLQMREDGSFQLGSAAVQSGHVVTAGNGNRYRLTLAANDTWSAEFVAPDPLRLSLGTSGDAVHIEIREDRSFWLDGSPLQAGREVRAVNGNRYTLTLGPAGMWQAMFVVPEPQRVPLGMSGRTVLVSKLESGTYQLAGGPLWTGEVRDTGGGATYRFLLGTDGRWSATYVAQPTTVHLGAHGGTIRVVRQENGAWTLGSQTIRSGHELLGFNGHTYQLTLVAGEWRAEPQPMSIQVPLQGTGGSIVLTRVEDGTYLYGGTAVKSGDTITVRGTRYFLIQASGGSWRASLTSDPTLPAPWPGEPLTSDSLVSYVGVSPRPRLTDDGSSSSREGSIFELNGIEYSVNALFRHGREDRQTTFAEEAYALIAAELNDIQALIGLTETTSDVVSEIERRWDRIADHLDLLFRGEGQTLLGQDTPKRRSGAIDYEEVVEDIEDVLAALRSSSAFQDALEDGIFSQSRRVDADDSDDTFFAVRSMTRLGFGWTTATRYGAYSKQERSTISHTLNFAPGTEGIGAFAYSPLQTTRTRELPSSGEAIYFGETIAASRESDQGIYTGDIELRVRFASRQVTALITTLQDAGGGAWYYSQRAVDAIHLPAATLDSGNGTYEPISSSTARVSFSPTTSSFSSRSLGSDFEGRFVGRGDAAGRATIGTWSLKSSGSVVLTGGFGANLESGPARPGPVVRPVPPTGDAGQVSATYIRAQPDSSGDIRIAARDSDNDRIKLAASELYTNGGALVVGERLFERARAVLDDQVTLLGVYRNLSGDSQALQNRDSVWRTANQALRDNIFGSLEDQALGATYPSSGSSLARRDDDAIEMLQDARQALSSPGAFRDAVEDGGFFEDILSQSKLDDGEYDFQDIYSAVDHIVQVEYDNTNYARFGAWAKRVRDNSLAPSVPATGVERSDVFAYSPIGQTQYSSGDRNFPRNFTSNYVGRTVAVDPGLDGSTFYTGDISLSVRWRSDSPSGSSVTSVIENLARADTGEPFLDAGFDVSHLIFDGASVELDSENRIGFRGTSLVRVRYFDPGRRERSYSSGWTEGKFVGYELSGPRGVIGVWDMGDIKGAFGADLAP